MFEVEKEILRVFKLFKYSFKYFNKYVKKMQNFQIKTLKMLLNSSQNINSLIQDLSNKIDGLQQTIVDISSKTSKNEQIAQNATVQSKQTATAMVN